MSTSKTCKTSTSKTAKHTAMVAFWKKHIIDRKLSGLTVKAYCEENNLTAGRYYYWLRVIQNECMEYSSSEEVSLPTSSTEEIVSVSTQKSPAPDFVEVQLPAALATSSQHFTTHQDMHSEIHPLMLTLPGNITIAIQDSSTVSLLCDVLSSLRKAGLT